MVAVQDRRQRFAGQWTISGLAQNIPGAACLIILDIFPDQRESQKFAVQIV